MQAAPPDRADWIVRGLAVAGLAGILACIAGGVGARMAMRLFAIAVGQSTAFTIEGSMFIVVFGLLFGPALAVGYVLVHRVVPGPWPLRGLLYGAALAGLEVLAFSGAPVDEAGPNPTLGTGLFATLAVLLGLVIAGATAWLERRLATPAATPGLLTGVGALIGALGALLLSALLLSAAIGFVD